MPIMSRFMTERQTCCLIAANEAKTMRVDVIFLEPTLNSVDTVAAVEVFGTVRIPPANCETSSLLPSRYD